MSISEHEAKVLSDFEAYEAEIGALRARADTAERQRDGLAQTISIAARETATLALRVAELERERDAADTKYANWRAELKAEVEPLQAECHRLKADAARLREALEETVQQGDIVGAYSENEVFMLRHYMRVAWLAAKAALASAPSAEPEGPDYSGLCSAPECGGHCGYVHAVGCEAIREYLAEHGGDAYRAPARTAHLAATPSAEPKCPGPDCKACNSEACDKCGKGSWNVSAPACTHDALQRHEAQSAEPTPREKAEKFFAGCAGDDDAGVLAWSEASEPAPRDMRVAEAVRREASGMVRDADDGVPLNCLADAVETIDLAAVVAKALEVGT